MMPDEDWGRLRAEVLGVIVYLNLRPPDHENSRKVMAMVEEATTARALLLRIKEEAVRTEDPRDFVLWVQEQLK